MKKSIIFLVVLVALLALAGPALANSTSAEFVIGLNQYFVNDQTPGIQMDAAPYIDASSGRTLVPVRYLADALGATTNWDADTQTVAVTTAVYNISMVIGSTTLTVNGQAQTMDVAPVINDGRTYLPARYVAKTLGYNVDWDATNKIVVIYPTSDIGEPGYSNAIQQAQLNAATPEQVQKLDAALGITMFVDTGGSGDWWYDPRENADFTANPAFINHNSSFVVVQYIPGDSNTSSEVEVGIECQKQDTSEISVDLSPLQKVLEAFFPGQDADIQQAMADAQKQSAHAVANYGYNHLPADVLMINGIKVGIGQGGSGNVFASLMILSS